MEVSGVVTLAFTTGEDGHQIDNGRMNFAVLLYYAGRGGATHEKKARRLLSFKRMSREPDRTFAINRI